MAAQDLQGGNSGWASRGTWYAATSLEQISRLNPNCGNAFSCTDYSGILSPIVTNPSQPSLQIGPIKSENVTTSTATIIYGDFRLESRRLIGVSSCPTSLLVGETTGSPPVGIEVGNTYTQAAASQTLVTPVITRLLSDPSFGPGFYYFRLSFRITATSRSNANLSVVSVHSINSRCVRAGFAPQITGIRDDATGLEDEIKRGGSGPYLQIYGNNVQGTFGSSISPSTGIAQWAITGVYPASGQVNLSYSVQSSAPTGERAVTLSNGIGASPPWPIWITDPSPQITSVTPDRPWQPGETITVQVNGKGFGSDPIVTLRATDADTNACLGSESVSIIGPAPGTARDSQITFMKSIPADSVTCNFDLQITSSGLSGSFFQGRQSAPRSEQAIFDMFVGRSRAPRLIVYIVRGISDNHNSLANLKRNIERLPGFTGLTINREVNATFDFLECASIATGAERLVQHIRSRIFQPGDRIALIGHSMGWLIIRRMLAQGLLYSNTTTIYPPIVGLVTLGTPHLGYLYKSVDSSVKCAIQSQEMESHLDIATPGITLQPWMLSQFLFGLRDTWSLSQVAGNWLAIAGRACDRPVRNIGAPENGCRSTNPFSDSVVCVDSAGLLYPGAGMTPTSSYNDPEGEFQHGVDVGFSTGLNVLCGQQTPRKLSLTDPPFVSDLFNKIRDFLNAL